MSSISIKLLNHASVLIRYNGFSLVSDPWYFGTSFGQGWGLRYDNPKALEEASQCSHLWISHLHSDHFHFPTLKQLFSMNPNLIVLSNPSANFNTRLSLESVGFKKFIPLLERKITKFSEKISLTRFPTTGIDNFLLIKLGGFTILNYNDVNIPFGAIKSLMKKVGNIDFLLLNFNHAGKLIQKKTIEEIKEKQKDLFLKIVTAIQPRFVIPFASMHYYRSPFSQEQNNSLLSVGEISSTLENVIPLEFGDEVSCSNQRNDPVIGVRTESSTLIPQTTHFYKNSHEWDQIINNAEKFLLKINKEFFGLTFWIPQVVIWVEDLNKGLIMDLKGKNISCSETFNINEAQICSHSEPLMDLFYKPYGPIDFHVGAHYRFISNSTTPIVRFLIACGLIANGLSLRKIVKMILTLKGWKFFINRREEILETLFRRKFEVESRL